MYKKNHLMDMLKKMGIEPTDTLFIHSSMKAIGQVEGGADTVLDALMEYLEEGLLVLPTHTWATMNEVHYTYDPSNEPACVGILPNLFMKRDGVLRSLHPTHSVAAYGRDSADFIAGEEDQHTPCAVGGCYDRLRDRNAKILLIGVNHARNTFIHCVEEILDVPQRLTVDPVLFHIVMPDKSIKENKMYRHYNPTTDHISEAYVKLDEAFQAKSACKKVSFGDASCILCDANKIYETTEQVLSHNLNCLMELDEIPRGWYSDYTIQQATPNDIITIQDLGSRAFAENFAHMNDPQDIEKYLYDNFRLEQIQAEVANPESQFFFAMDQDVPVGYLKVNVGQAQTEKGYHNSLEIQRIYILKNYKGKGIGSILMKRAIDIAIDLGLEYIWLGVWEHNEAALGFYHSKGFGKIGSHTFMVGDDAQVDHIMRMDLN